MRSPRTPTVHSREELLEFQRQMATLLFQPLNTSWGMRKRSKEGENLEKAAEIFVMPNDQLSSFERLEIYSRSYWFRVLDSLYEDFPGLLSLLGNQRFLRLATAYLERYPSQSFTLRNLGSRLEGFLTEEAMLAAPSQEMALDMIRFEWAQIVAFDGPSRKPISRKQIAASSPSDLQLGLQPYLSLLDLNHAVDHYLIAVKNQETGALRHEASNTTSNAPEQTKRGKRPALPTKERVYLAVHRYDNQLYYKRLEPTAFAILSALRVGLPLQQACEQAMGFHGTTECDLENFSQSLTAWFADWASLGWLTPPFIHS